MLDRRKIVTIRTVICDKCHKRLMGKDKYTQVVFIEKEVSSGQVMQSQSIDLCRACLTDIPRANRGSCDEESEESVSYLCR